MSAGSSQQCAPPARARRALTVNMTPADQRQWVNMLALAVVEQTPSEHALPGRFKGTREELQAITAAWLRARRNVGLAEGLSPDAGEHGWIRLTCDGAEWCSNSVCVCRVEVLLGQLQSGACQVDVQQCGDCACVGSASFGCVGECGRIVCKLSDLSQVRWLDWICLGRVGNSIGPDSFGADGFSSALHVLTGYLGIAMSQFHCYGVR